MKIDVCVPSLKPLSEDFVKRLEETIPVSRILVDSTKGRGTSRQKLIGLVETEMFAFVDTDVVLMPRWFGDVSTALRGKVGAVEGRAHTDTGNRNADNVLSSMQTFSRFLGRSGPMDTVDRAFTGATLIRTDAVKGIRIPNIHYYEDDWIRLHVERKGLKWIRTPAENFVHLISGRDMVAETYESARCGYQVGILDPMDQVERLVFIEPIKAAFILMQSGDTAAARHLIRQRIQTTRGVLHAYVQHFKLSESA